MIGMDEIVMVCQTCGFEGELTHFVKNRTSAHGHRALCKSCCKIANHNAYAQNRERRLAQAREYRTRPEVKLARKTYRANPSVRARSRALRNRPEVKARAKAYETTQARKAKRKAYSKSAKGRAYRRAYEQRPEVRARRKLYRARPEVRARKNARELKRLEVDAKYRLVRTLRARWYQAFKGRAKHGSGVQNLGCSLQEFYDYLESKFLPGMTWQNYGLHGWHRDHIIPLTSFDLTDPEQVKLAAHYTNQQPLWARDNLVKGAKLPDE